MRKWQRRIGYETDKMTIVREYIETGLPASEIVSKHGLSSPLVLFAWVDKYLSRKECLSLEPETDNTTDMTKKTKQQLEEEPKKAKEENKRLKEALELEKLRSRAFDTMIDVAEKNFNIPIRKKAGTKQKTCCARRRPRHRWQRCAAVWLQQAVVQVNRNIERFPKDFMFELTHEEYDSLRCQIGTLKSGRGQHAKYLPYVFTEEGVAMLSGVLRSKTAIQVNINIMRAFVLIRQTVAAWQSANLKVEQLSHKVDQLNAYIEEILHDQNDVNEQQEVTNNEIAIQIEMINDALDQLRFKPQQSRTRIGYKK